MLERGGILLQAQTGKTEPHPWLDRGCAKNRAATVIFNSPVYFLFLILVVFVYHCVLRSTRKRNWLLFVAGSIFYAAWSPAFLVLLYATIVLDWAVGRALESPRFSRKRKTVLLASLGFNLGILAFFKYTNFAASILDVAFVWLGCNAKMPRLDVELPLGISFYTFLSLSYTIDVYRGSCAAEKSLLNYGVFVSFFPHLIAGPILRGPEFLQQVEAPDSINLRGWFGINRIIIGLVKKVLIADWLARFVEPVYSAPGAYDGIACVLATYLYAFQIYLDFSGYIDIAFGSAALLGYKLPDNFDSPYLSRNISEFWRRWHITLSSWLRDYVYIVIGGNRRGRFRAYISLVLTMLVGGLWHGPSMNFVIWGGIQGCLLVVHKIFSESRRRPIDPGGLDPRYRVSFGGLVLFQAICFSWIFFRAPTLSGAIDIVYKIAGLPEAIGSGNVGAMRVAVAVLASPLLLMLYMIATRVRRAVENHRPTGLLSAVVYGMVLACLLAVIAAGAAPPAQFIYFVF